MNITLDQNNSLNRMQTTRYNKKSDKFNLICCPNNFTTTNKTNGNPKMKISKESIQMAQKKDLKNFNSTRRSKIKLSNKIPAGRREGNLNIKNIIPNLPQLNSSVPERKPSLHNSSSRNKSK